MSLSTAARTCGSLKWCRWTTARAATRLAAAPPLRTKPCCASPQRFGVLPELTAASETGPVMAQTAGLLEELERAVSQGSEQSRVVALTYATDLLIAGRYTEEETCLLGGVVGLPAAEIEPGARAELSHPLAALPNI